MKSLMFILYSALAASSPILDTRQSTAGTFSITNFAASSSFDGDMGYELDVTNGKVPSVTCSTSNNIRGSQCDGAAIPGPFDQTFCSDPHWAWELTETSSTTAFGFALKILYYETVGGPVVAHGCKSLTDNITCTDGEGQPFQEGAIWNVPTDFTLQALSGNGDCFFTGAQ